MLRWEKDQLPLDVWGLDMNWRNVTRGQDGPTGAIGNPERSYNHPNTTLFPNFTQFFGFLKSKGLRYVQAQGDRDRPCLFDFGGKGVYPLLP